jgi:hypothetical protein
MQRRDNLSSRVSLTLAALVTSFSATAQTPAVSAAPAAPGTPQFAIGTVFDVKGDVSIMHGARIAAATRGTTVQPGDRVFVQPDAIVLIRCPESDVQRITTAGSFTFSGCQPAALAAAARPATTPAPGTTPAPATAAAPATGSAPAIASTPVPPAGTPPPVTGEVVRRSGMSGGTLGVIGGLLLVGAAAGGGGGGGGGGSGSTSPPVSP